MTFTQSFNKGRFEVEDSNEFGIGLARGVVCSANSNELIKKQEEYQDLPRCQLEIESQTFVAP